MLTRVIGEDITLETGLTEALWTIEADESQVEQVLMNLAVNARDAMPGGGLLSINTRNIIDCQDIHADISMPGQCVALVVEDNGCGMDKETRSRVFEPFFTTKPSGQGTGLGLATVHGIVHQSGGSIIVESDPGAGSRFTVLLPRCLKPEQSRSSSDVTAVVQGHGRVLVVEDSAGLRRLVKRMLHRAGFDVLVADGPADVVEFSESQLASLDLVLTDVIMPQMNGPELAVWLNTKRPKLPVVFMTGYTEEEVLRRGVEADLSGFLQKPFTQGDLLEKVTRNLRTRELGA